MASPCDSVDEAEEDVEEPWAERLIQQSGLCKLVLTGGGGATTEDSLRTDVSSSEPDEESKKQKKATNDFKNYISICSVGGVRHLWLWILPGGVRVSMGDCT